MKKWLEHAVVAALSFLTRVSGCRTIVGQDARMKYRKSFYDHGCTEAIADHVIDYGLWYQLHDSERGNEQVIYVGWDTDGENLWEVGIELYPEGLDDWVFHAQEATAYAKKQVKL